MSKAEIQRDLQFTPWKKGDQEAHFYTKLMVGAFVLVTLWAVLMAGNSLYRGYRENWVFMVFTGILWLAFGPYLIFQIRYSLRVKRLLAQVHHKSFKRRRMFTRQEPVKQVMKALRSTLKKENIMFKTGEIRFRIPEVGRFKHNLYVKKMGIRIIVKKHTLTQPGDGSILLYPEKTTREKLDRLKELIEDGLG